MEDLEITDEEFNKIHTDPVAKAVVIDILRMLQESDTSEANELASRIRRRYGLYVR